MFRRLSVQYAAGITADLSRAKTLGEVTKIYDRANLAVHGPLARIVMEKGRHIATSVETGAKQVARDLVLSDGAPDDAALARQADAALARRADAAFDSLVADLEKLDALMPEYTAQLLVIRGLADIRRGRLMHAHGDGLSPVDGPAEQEWRHERIVALAVALDALSS